MSSHDRPTLGVILSQFPRYDEAFILRELVELAQGPWELVIFSLRPCRDRIVHAQAKALQPKTVYAPFVASRALWRAHGRFLRERPSAYWGALGWIVSRHWTHPLVLFKTLILFPKTVFFAEVMRQQGIRHLHAFWATYPATSAIVISRLTGATYSLSGHAHDLYTTTPALREKILGARFMLTCTEANRDYILSLLGNHRAGSDHRPQSTVDKNNTAGQAQTPWTVDRGRSEVGGAVHRPQSTDHNNKIHLSTVDCGLWTTPEIIVSYHGVDLSRFAPVDKPTGQVFQVLCIGSLFPCKGLETLIDACARLSAKGVAYRCTIAGGGPLDAALRKQIDRCGVREQVEITGYVSQERVVELYQQAHAFVLPLISKIHWGIPNVLIEALATKTPVITCNLPSLRELVVHEDSGLIIPEQDPAALAEAILRLRDDRALANRLAQSGYGRVAERFSLQRTGHALRALFGECVA